MVITDLAALTFMWSTNTKTFTTMFGWKLEGGIGERENGGRVCAKKKQKKQIRHKPERPSGLFSCWELAKYYCFDNNIIVFTIQPVRHESVVAQCAGGRGRVAPRRRPDCSRCKIVERKQNAPQTPRRRQKGFQNSSRPPPVREPMAFKWFCHRCGCVYGGRGVDKANFYFDHFESSLLHLYRFEISKTDDCSTTRSETVLED